MDGNDKRCDHCRTGVALLRYCHVCSPKASALYKRNERREAKAAGERYWLDWWVKVYGDASLLKRREYQRQYMRSYRRRPRSSENGARMAEPGERAEGLRLSVFATKTPQATTADPRRTTWTHSN